MSPRYEGKPKDLHQMGLVEDQEPVEQLAAHGAD
jgi:hypothetical protein